MKPFDQPVHLAGDVAQIDRGTDQEGVGREDAVKDGLLKKSTPVETLVHIFMCELYGMMTCWCMSDAKFKPEEWVSRFAKLQLPAILAPYMNVNDRKGKEETR